MGRQDEEGEEDEEDEKVEEEEEEEDSVHSTVVGMPRASKTDLARPLL